MTKKQKVQLAIIWICIITMIAMILIYIASVVIDIYQKHERGKQTILEFNELNETEEKQVILFATPYCPFCQEMKKYRQSIMISCGKLQSFPFTLRKNRGIMVWL